MAQNPDEPWFYSQAGQQKGPVPFSELQAIVNAGELHPTSDLVWKQGMANWTPVVQMRDTFKVANTPEPAPQPKPEPKPEPAPAPQPAPEPAASAAPAPAPAAQTLPPIEPAPAPEPKPEPKPAPKPEPKPEPKPLPAPSSQPKPASKQGIQAAAPAVEEKKKKKPEAEVAGANRGHFFLGVYLFPMVWLFILSFVIAATADSGLGGIIALVGILIPIVVAIVVTLKRFTNLAMSRWWIFGNMVPFLNLWVGYRLFACPWGYGAGRKMDGLGIGLAILYWLILILALASIPLIIAIVITSIIDNPKLIEDPATRAEINRALIELRALIQSL